MGNLNALTFAAADIELSPTIGRLATIDWVVIILYIMMMLAIGILLSRRARKSMSDFFTSGGAMPWYLLGTSMVATTFAADTPLAISGFVYSKGISGNWFWWCQVAVTMLGVFFFAHLWKRANLTTDNEFVDLRYSGKPARVLRGFRAIYFSLVYSCIIMGWVNLAMVKIVSGLMKPTDLRIEAIDKPMERLLLATGFIPTENPIAVGRSMTRHPAHPVVIKVVRDSRIAIGSEDDDVTAAYRPVEELLRAVMTVQHNERQLLELDLLSENYSTISQVAEALDGLAVLDARIPPNVDPALPSSNLTAGTYPLRDPLEFHTVGREDVFRLDRGEYLASYDASLVERLNRVLTLKILLICFVVTVAYCAIGGLWSVVVTDFIQFIIAMAGAIYLAWVAVAHFGGLGPLIETVQTGFGEVRANAMMTMLPTLPRADLEMGMARTPGTFPVEGGFQLMSLGEFLVYVLIFWYAVGFTDGGSYLAQRMIGARSERDATLGYLWYGVMHYCVRMWPWLLVGLAAACLFPSLDKQQAIDPGAISYDPEMNYIYAMRVFLGPGLLGIMIASFLAAYMSTISTQVNLAASYVVNDFYKPFIVPEASEKHYVLVSTLATIAVAFFGIFVTLFMTSIMGAWFLLASLNAGIGLVYLLRWYWWRVNAWSEITCFATVLIATAILQGVVWGDLWEKAQKDESVTVEGAIPDWYYEALESRGFLTKFNAFVNLQVETESASVEPIPSDLEDSLGPEAYQKFTDGVMADNLNYESITGEEVPEGMWGKVIVTEFNWGNFPYRLIPLVIVSLVAWLTVTLLTRPTNEEKLKAFYRRIRPGGPGWRHIAAECPDVDPGDTTLRLRNFIGWIVCVIAIYSALFGFGQLFLGSWGKAATLLIVTLVSGFYIYRMFSADKPAAAESPPR